MIKEQNTHQLQNIEYFKKEKEMQGNMFHKI